MDVVRVFLASSIVEFARERVRVEGLISDANRLCARQGCVLLADLCEDQSSALVLTRKQDEYNDLIKQDQLFVIILGQRVGKYTIEELEVAVNGLSEGRNPQAILALLRSDLPAPHPLALEPRDMDGTEVAAMLLGFPGCTVARFETAEDIAREIFRCLHENGLTPLELTVDAGHVRAATQR